MPIIFIVKNMTRFVMIILGINQTKQSQFTESDIRGAINLGVQHGSIKRSEQRMMDAVLDLDDLTVADVMIHRSAVAALDINTSTVDVPAALGLLKHSRVPVYENQADNIIGFLYVRDYLHQLSKVENRKQVKLRDCVRPTYFVPETSPVGHQLIEFLKNRTHMALVVNEYGDLQGLITLEDILEEIVGDITDEHDNSHAEEAAADESVMLLGKTHVRDINRRYNWHLPEDSAVTLAGLLIDHLHRLPAQGENIVIGNLVLTVSSKRGHRIEKVHIIPVESKIKAAV
jgi:Mg2+/Co2+ transporter CorB